MKDWPKRIGQKGLAKKDWPKRIDQKGGYVPLKEIYIYLFFLIFF